MNELGELDDNVNQLEEAQLSTEADPKPAAKPADKPAAKTTAAPAKADDKKAADAKKGATSMAFTSSLALAAMAAALLWATCDKRMIYEFQFKPIGVC